MENTNDKIIIINIDTLFRLVQEYKEFIKELPRETTEDWIYVHNIKIEMRAYNRILNDLGLERSINRLHHKRSRKMVHKEIEKQEKEEEQNGKY